MHRRIVLAFALGLMVVPGVTAQEDKLRPKDPNVAPHWIYDDVPAAFAKASHSGKPILALFR
jgi:hypothetical protein